MPATDVLLYFVTGVWAGIIAAPILVWMTNVVWNKYLVWFDKNFGGK